MSVYLKPDLDRCAARVAARARPGEVVSAEYQLQLRAAHAALFDTAATSEVPWTTDKCVTLEGALANDDFATDPAAAKRAIEFIVQKLAVAHGV